MNKINKGFTLVELLVTVGIIGLLATILLANFNGSRQRARDTQRITDVKKIQTSLELYKSDNQAYPCFSPPGTADCAGSQGWGTINTLTLLSPTYLQTIPQDPLYKNTCQGYLYWHSGSLASYAVFSVLESSNDPRVTAVKTAPPVGLGACVSGCKSFKITAAGACSGTTFNYWVLSQ